MLALLVASAIAAPWVVEPLHLGTDRTTTDGDIATGMAVAVHGTTRWVALERETVVAGTRLRQLQLGWSACDDGFTSCDPPVFVDLGLPSEGPLGAPSLAIEAGSGDAPRVHVLWAAPNAGRCGGATDLEAWVYDAATETTERTVVDSPPGCERIARSGIAVTNTDAWACWTRTGPSGPQAWCGERPLTPGASWSTDWAADLDRPVERAGFAVFDEALLVASHPPGPAPLTLSWDGATTGTLPTTVRSASQPALATAPDGSLHAAWVERGRSLQVATCPAGADCTDGAAWSRMPEPVREAHAIGTPELTISEDGRVFLAWTEDDPLGGRRVVVEDRCPSDAAFAPSDPLPAPVNVADHQSLLLGGPHLWAEGSTVHLGWTEHDRRGLTFTQGDAWVARRDVEPCSGEDPRIASFEAVAADAGWAVQRGAYAFLEVGDCCSPGVSCYGNNPGGAYGYSLVPPSPRAGASTGSGMEIDGAQQYFRLDDDEVVVLLGRTPPPARYFGYRTHVAYRDIAGDRAFVLATNGLDRTSWDIQQHTGLDDVSLRPLALVTSADADREAEVHQLLADAGFLPDEIEDDRIGADLTVLGVDATADELATIHRTAVFDDPAVEAAYRDDPGLVVLRLTPDTPRPSLAPHTDPGRPTVLSGEDEAAWEPSLDALDDALVASWPGWTVDRLTYTRAGASPDRCLADGTTCGDLSSRFFARTGVFDLPSDGSFAVAIGVNHERSGRASYSSFSTHAWAHNVGLHSVESPEMVGSATHLLPADPLVDDLFAIVMARDCTLFPDGICLEIPFGCPGVAETGILYGASRLYVDPVTGTAPALSEIMGDRVLVFRP